MTNHKWSDDKCIHCGITRQYETQALLMAVTEQPPYNHYKYTTKYCYYKLDGVWTFIRPDCYEGWLLRVKKEQKHYPAFKGHDLNEVALKHLFVEGKTPIDALNDLMTAC